MLDAYQITLIFCQTYKGYLYCESRQLLKDYNGANKQKEDEI